MGRLALDQKFEGQGLGNALLDDALHRSNSSEIMAYAMVVDAKDDIAAHFYKYHGFFSLPNVQQTLFLPLATAQKSYQPNF